MKENIQNVEKELIEEKLNVKALSEELENPMNQERYRKLEGTDCDSYEMSTKIEALQKRLITKTEEVNLFFLFLSSLSILISSLSFKHSFNSRSFLFYFFLIYFYFSFF